MKASGPAAVLAALFLGAAVLWWGTEGFRVFTAEGARRAAVERSPRPLPEVAMEDQAAKAVSLADFRGRVVLLDFVYTRCPTVCTVLGTGFQRLRQQIVGSGLEGQVVLVTFSFDPEHDGAAQLQDYADRYGGADSNWHFVRAPSRADTDTLLRAAELVAVPDGFGGYVHNAAIHVVDREGRLARIVDTEATDEAFRLARSLLR